VPACGGSDRTADADGLVDADEESQITEYSWDQRNRLVEVTERDALGGAATQVVDLLYDVLNRWIGENVDSDGDGQIDQQTRFVYDGQQIVLQFDGDCPDFAQQNGTVPFTTDEDGAPQLTAANLTHRYLWGSAVDQLLCDEQVEPGSTEGTPVWALSDQLGTVRDLAVLDAATGVTSVANHRAYNSFGQLTSETNAALDCLFGFPGRALDPTPGLQNNLNRWYDPALGEWMSNDPLGLKAGDANTGR